MLLNENGRDLVNVVHDRKKFHAHNKRGTSKKMLQNAAKCCKVL